ncbi:jg21659 [Pararge aegeria aegeria]|uniref:Jg21659 protein n=1 Tax=Pararge aegeria aegeria TaxID=348720 RepID=A0A8S4RJH9_9NEOP|nr:jg21659 [Pararge aegeria aegeria]
MEAGRAFQILAVRIRNEDAKPLLRVRDSRMHSEVGDVTVSFGERIFYEGEHGEGCDVRFFHRTSRRSCDVYSPAITSTSMSASTARLATLVGSSQRTSSSNAAHAVTFSERMLRAPHVTAHASRGASPRPHPLIRMENRPSVTNETKFYKIENKGFVVATTSFRSRKKMQLL